jgi:hypothetical protein
MIRFVDKTAFDDVRYMFENPRRVTTPTTDIFFAFVGGYSCGKNLGIFWDFVKDALGLDRCRSPDDELREYFRGNDFDDSMQVMCGLIDRFLQWRPWCDACGEPIELEDEYFRKGQTIKLYHTSCVRRAVSSTPHWDVCAVCGEPITTKALKTALRKLQRTVFSEERLPYPHVKWRHLLIDEQREFDDLNAKIPESLPLLERMRRFEEMLVMPETLLFQPLFRRLPHDGATHLRRRFEPLHAECVPRRSAETIVPLQGTTNHHTL